MWVFELLEAQYILCGEKRYASLKFNFPAPWRDAGPVWPRLPSRTLKQRLCRSGAGRFVLLGPKGRKSLGRRWQLIGIITGDTSQPSFGSFWDGMLNAGVLDHSLDPSTTWPNSGWLGTCVFLTASSHFTGCGSQFFPCQLCHSLNMKAMAPTDR